MDATQLDGDLRISDELDELSRSRPPNGKRRALRRTVLGEHADDECAARLDRSTQQLHVGCPIVVTDEEAEYRTIMPDGPPPWRLPGEQIPLDPFHTGRIGQTASSLGERTGEHIQHGHVTMAPLQQTVDQPARAPTDDDPIVS